MNDEAQTDHSSEENSFRKRFSSTQRTMERVAASVTDRLLAKQITVYPTYGYQHPTSTGPWRVPVRVWVHDNRDTPFVETGIDRLAAHYLADDLGRPLSDAERVRLARVLEPFIADDKTNESIELTFASDPTIHRLKQRTGVDGVIEEIVELSNETVHNLLADSESNESWCEIRARTTDGRGSGTGSVRFLRPDGLSVISDIDDTVKITQVPAGKKTVLRNTLLQEFRPAEGMRERFRGITSQAAPEADVCFHYISGGPWQLFAPLHEFLIDNEEFPRGTFHMKKLRTNLFDSGALQTINDFAIAGDLATLDQKVRQITALMIHFPKRKFILVGDSGEKDPEVYHAIRKLFPEQVIRIIIRDVLCERLAGMELITGADVPVALDLTALEREMEQLVLAARDGGAAHSEKL